MTSLFVEVLLQFCDSFERYDELEVNVSKGLNWFVFFKECPYDGAMLLEVEI